MEEVKDNPSFFQGISIENQHLMITKLQELTSNVNKMFELLSIITKEEDPKENLTELAITVGEIISKLYQEKPRQIGRFSSQEIKERIGTADITDDEVRKRLVELEGSGCIKIERRSMSGQISFKVLPYLYNIFPDLTFVNWELDERVLLELIIEEIRSKTVTDGNKIKQKTGWSDAKINLLVCYLEERNLLEVTTGIGSAPFSFHFVRPNDLTETYYEKEYDTKITLKKKLRE